jgi:hypothetical protein
VVKAQDMLKWGSASLTSSTTKSEKYSEENRRQYDMWKISSKSLYTLCDFIFCHAAVKKNFEDSRKKSRSQHLDIFFNNINKLPNIQVVVAV